MRTSLALFAARAGPRWMYDREPIMNWLAGNVVLLGDSAHPPLQYMAQGAIMAIEDGWVLGEHVRRNRGDDGSVDWPAVLQGYNAVRPEHCRRVLTTAREWGQLWHHTGEKRELRNIILSARGGRLLLHRLGLGPHRPVPRGGARDVQQDPAGFGQELTAQSRRPSRERRPAAVWRSG